MKTTFTLLFVLLFLSTAVFSQSSQNRTLRVGFKAGTSLSNLAFADAPHKLAANCPNGCLGSLNTSKTYQYQTNLWADKRTGIALGVFGERQWTQKNGLLVEINYESKGINLRHSQTQPTSNGEGKITYSEYFNRKISNDYLTLSALFKRKMGSNERFYWTGGLYSGLLLQSEATLSNGTSQKYIASNDEPYVGTGSENGYDFSASGKDKKREHTTRVDAGISGGAGIDYPLTSQLHLIGDVRLNFGLLKVDRKNNNEYREVTLPTTSGFSREVYSRNYFSGLNSQARNVNATITIGLAYQLGSK